MGGEALGASGGSRLGGFARVPAEGREPLLFPLAWELTDEYVHCVAASGDTGSGRLLERVTFRDSPDCAGTDRSDLSERERASVRSLESAAVRRLAKVLAFQAGGGEVEVVREPIERGFAPPRLFARGAAEPLAGWDLTLSHDGAFVAAVLSHP